MFQSLHEPPSLHVIVEAHPDVLAHMEEKGWHKKANVKILNGKWQDVLSSDEFIRLGKYDVIYIDTFAENYHGELSIPEPGVTLIVLQSFTSSSNVCQVFWMGLTLGLVFSTD